MRINSLFLPATMLALLPAISLSSCCPCRRAGASTADSLRIETHIRRETLRDTVYIALPRESERAVVRDTVSRLETSLAISCARINADGSLSHTLSNRRAELPAAVDRVTEVRDSIVWRDRTVVQRVEVGRPLSAWQQLRLRGFWVLLAVSAVLLRAVVKKI